MKLAEFQPEHLGSLAAGLAATLLPFCLADLALSPIWPFPQIILDGLAYLGAAAVFVFLLRWKPRGQTIPNHVRAALRTSVGQKIQNGILAVLSLLIAAAFLFFLVTESLKIWAIALFAVGCVGFLIDAWQRWRLAIAAAPLEPDDGYLSKWALVGLLGIPPMPLSEEWKRKNRTHIEADGYTFPVKIKDWMIRRDGSRAQVTAKNGDDFVLTTELAQQAWGQRKVLETNTAQARRKDRVWLPILTALLFGAFLWQLWNVGLIGHERVTLASGVLFFIFGPVFGFYGLLTLRDMLRVYCDSIRYARGSQKVQGPKMFDRDPDTIEVLGPVDFQPHGITDAQTI